MKKRFVVDVNVPDDATTEDVANDLKLAIMKTDGEQHLEHMNWEPIPMTDPKVTPVQPVVLTGTKVTSKDLSNTGDVMFIVEQTRQKIFSAKRLPGDEDGYETEKVLLERLADEANKGELDFTDAPVVFYQYNWAELNPEEKPRNRYNDTADWKEIWPHADMDEELPATRIDLDEGELHE